MADFRIPGWSYWVMGIGFALFIALVVFYIVKNRGLKRPVFASPYMLWIVIFTVIPVLLIAYFAFTDANGQFTVENFKQFWDKNHIVRSSLTEKQLASLEKRGMTPMEWYPYDGSNVNALLHSVWMAFQCTFICLIAGYPAAHIMADREFKLGTTLIILFMVPMWMNFALRTYALVELMEDDGLINSFLKTIGIGQKQLLNTDGAVLVGMVYNYLPFMVFPIYNSLNKMDYKLTEAAMDLGCNKWKTFYKVTLPLSLPGIISGITMVFMPAVTTFAISRMMGGGKTIPLFGDLIEKQFIGTNPDWYVGSAMSLIMMVLILLSLGLLQKADPKGEGGGIV